MYYHETEANLRKWEAQVKKLENRQAQQQVKDEPSPTVMIERQEALIDQQKHNLKRIDEAWQMYYTNVSEVLVALEQGLEQVKKVVQE
jgi:hemoglobin-like flavoprotein